MHPSLLALRDIREKLNEYVYMAEAFYTKDRNDFTRMICVKAYFTYLEGTIYAFKQVILNFESIFSPIPHSGARIILFSDEQRAMLAEFTYDLSGHTARKSTYYPKFGDNIKFTFAMFHHALDLPNDVDYNNVGWNRVLEAQKIRNRLTHPKSRECLTVTDQELELVEEAVGWYEENANRALERMRESKNARWA